MFRTLMGTFFVTVLPLIGERLSLLRLRCAFLLGTLVEGRREVFQGADKVMSEIALRFVGFFNRFRYPLDCACKLIKG
jgi:hypothetical protein